MKTLTAVVASLAINAGLIAGFVWAARASQLPLGEVLVVQLPADSSVPAIADARQVGPSAARAL